MGVTKHETKMRDVWFKVVRKFINYPAFSQVIIVSLTWIFLFFSLDAWFSPFLISGYQLILYTVIIVCLSGWATYTYLYQIIQSPKVLMWFSDNSQVKPETSYESLKDVCGQELVNFANLLSQFVVDHWSDGSADNQEFIREIQNHVNDILHSITEKLSNVNIESFIRNLVQIIHNHVKNYMETRNTTHSPKHTKPLFLHPVTKGEMLLDIYLDCLSRAVMKEFIPGAFQDCSAIFDLSCAILNSQVLMKFIQSFSQPELILQSLFQLCELNDAPPVNSDTSHSLSKDKNIAQELLIETYLSEAQSTETQAPEPKGSCLSDVNQSRENADSLEPNILFGHASQLDESSYVQTGLSQTLSTATAPLFYSQSTSHYPSKVHIFSKPNSLPLPKPNNKYTTTDAISPPAPLSLEADVSPVYEDVEDFATAIAKLRSLLEQRNASTGSESAGSKGSSFSPSCDNTRTGSSGGETEGSFEELLEASEQQLDSRVFFNVKIPRTEVCSIPNEGQHSVYCISYDGIYSAVSTNNDDGQRESRLVLKNRTVRRRFRQFLELHSKLTKCEDPAILEAIRFIRGPSKWLNLPFSRLYPNTVAYRQSFLERYLQNLVECQTLGISNELRQFLEYELHLNENTSAPSSAALQRVPFFAKTVSGVLHSLKTALPLTIPGFENDQSRGVQLVPLPPPSPHSVTFDSTVDFKNIQTSSADDFDAISSAVTCRIGYSTESKLEEMLTTWAYRNCHAEQAFEAFETSTSRNVSLPDKSQNLYGSKTESYKSCLLLNESTFHEEGFNRFDNELPLSSSLINLVIECLSFRCTWIIRAPVPLMVKALFGQRIEMFLQESINKFAKPDKLSDGLRNVLRKLENGRHTPVAQPGNKQTVDELIAQIVGHLETRLPSLAVWIIGKNMCTDILNSTISCFTNAQLNRDLALTLLDFLFSQICEL